MKTILSSLPYPSGMWKINLVIMVALSICLALHLSIPHHSVFGQVNDTNETLILNDPRIMENTSGMIDDAFDALKDSFGSFFGK
jgi:hypothetical protein